MARARATLGGGCFWCLDAAFRTLEGVQRVTSGFSGGHVDSPSYREVMRGGTGHAEAVDIVFDDKVLSFRDLLDVFFTIHDPTTVDRQGNDVGPQYRSVIFYHDGSQERDARIKVRELEESGAFPRPVVTEIVPFKSFHPAEDYHQDYHARNRREPYCRLVIDPKLERLREVRDGRG